jgi:hypothetical protein
MLNLVNVGPKASLAMPTRNGRAGMTARPLNQE